MKADLPASVASKGGALVSAEVPDWSREYKGWAQWAPSRALLASIRSYQRHATARHPWSGILRKLAHHVDIGVAQLRNSLDLAWFDWLVGSLGGKDIPRAMHVEAIVWAAIAMRDGGGYFDPAHWYCWRYRQWKRVALKLGVPGLSLLKAEDLSKVKCFHASGIAKWWVKEACERNLFPAPRSVVESSVPKPFEELTLREYESDQRIKRIARKLGYYSLMKAGA